MVGAIRIGRRRDWPLKVSPSALWMDMNNDGDQDLFVTQRLATNKLYARMPDGSLQGVPDAGGLAGFATERSTELRQGYDKDGRLDVHLQLPLASGQF